MVQGFIRAMVSRVWGFAGVPSSRGEELPDSVGSYQCCNPAIAYVATG